jgi:hypothetical protein
MDKQRMRRHATVNRGDADRKREEAQEREKRQDELGAAPIHTNPAWSRDALGAHRAENPERRQVLIKARMSVRLCSTVSGRHASS